VFKLEKADRHVCARFKVKFEASTDRSRVRSLRDVCFLALVLCLSPWMLAQAPGSARVDTDGSVAERMSIDSPASVPTVHTGTGPDLMDRNAEYVTGPNDELRIEVWKEPAVSRDRVVVQPDGRISLPLVGVIKVGGSTPTEIQNMLEARLARFMTKPQVTVTVLRTKSKMVYLLGEVRKPGAYPLFGPIDVVQQIAKAGGLTSYARHKKIFVLRVVDGKIERFPVNLKKLLRGANSEQDILLQAGDTVVIP